VSSSTRVRRSNSGRQSALRHLIRPCRLLSLSTQPPMMRLRSMRSSSLAWLMSNIFLWWARSSCQVRSWKCTKPIKRGHRSLRRCSILSVDAWLTMFEQMVNTSMLMLVAVPLGRQWGMRTAHAPPPRSGLRAPNPSSLGAELFVSMSMSHVHILVSFFHVTRELSLCILTYCMCLTHVDCRACHMRCHLRVY
jgi:hypothetical protein